jgi:hypothetical protein
MWQPFVPWCEDDFFMRVTRSRHEAAARRTENRLKHRLVAFEFVHAGLAAHVCRLSGADRPLQTPSSQIKELSMSSAAAGSQSRSSLLGSLKDVLAAAGRENTLPGAAMAPAPSHAEAAPDLAAQVAQALSGALDESAILPASPSAADAAREVKGAPRPLDRALAGNDVPPTTRVVRSSGRSAADEPARTSLVRGKQQVKRGGFETDPVVGWLVVVGGPGIGQYRPIFEGNNTVGRSSENRIPIDFGDDAISAEAQAFVRYDSSDRSFLFVPNLAKTNVVSLNEKRPTAAVELQAMDVITMGRTQLIFVPFCGPEFDWSALAEG